MKTTYCDMPIVKCPNCEQETQWDDYYDIEQGSERECSECGVELEVLSVDHTINCRIGIKG